MRTDALSAELYSELHKLAHYFIRSERKDHTMSGTDLFHEAFSRLRPSLPIVVSDSGELRALFAITMRRILLDHARKKLRRERILSRVFLEQDLDCVCGSKIEDEHAEKLIDLDESLRRLQSIYPLHAQIVEMKYFGGMTVQQCGEHLGICNATVQRYWNFARAWIGREMERISLE